MTYEQIKKAPKGTFFAFNAHEENFAIMRKINYEPAGASDPAGAAYLIHDGPTAVKETSKHTPGQAQLRFDKGGRIPITDNSLAFYSVEPDDFRKSKIGMINIVFHAKIVAMNWD